MTKIVLNIYIGNYLTIVDNVILTLFSKCNLPGYSMYPSIVFFLNDKYIAFN